MKLSKIAILALRGGGVKAKARIANEIGASMKTVYGWVAENKINGPLTIAKSLEIISEETGLTRDQILEETDTKVIQG